MALDYQQALGICGSPYVIGWEGVDYPLTFRTQRFKSELESWVKRKVIREVVGVKSFYPEADYRVLVLDAQSKITEGHYSFGQAGFAEVVSSLEGRLQTLRMMLGEKGKDFSDERCIRFLDDNSNEMEIWNGAFETLKTQAEGDPEKKAELVRLGLIL